MPKIIKAGKVLTSNSLNAEMILSENTRKQNELDRIANDATRANVVEAIEIEYAPRLTTIESQLVDTVMAVDEIPATPLPRDSDRLGGFDASYFAPKASAQMFKLTADDGKIKATTQNLNACIIPGYYGTTSTTTNSPKFGDTFLVSVNRYSDVIFQNAVMFGNDKFYTRASSDLGATWTPWKEMADANNAIVESGANGNGKYVKFGDGTLMMWGNIPNTTVSTVIVNGYRTVDIPRTLPATLFEITGATLTVCGANLTIGSGSISSTTTLSTCLFSFDNGRNGSGYWEVIGRWK